MISVSLIYEPYKLVRNYSQNVGNATLQTLNNFWGVCPRTNPPFFFNQELTHWVLVVLFTRQGSLIYPCQYLSLPSFFSVILSTYRNVSQKILGKVTIFGCCSTLPLHPTPLPPAALVGFTCLQSLKFKTLDC